LLKNNELFLAIKNNTLNKVNLLSADAKVNTHEAE
jgi:hypothetical protein